MGGKNIFIRFLFEILTGYQLLSVLVDYKLTSCLKLRSNYSIGDGLLKSLWSQADKIHSKTTSATDAEGDVSCLD